MLITPSPLFSSSLADLREDGNGSHAIARRGIQSVPFPSRYFPTIDYSVNLESTRIMERVPLLSQFFFIVTDSPVNLEFFLRSKRRL